MGEYLYYSPGFCAVGDMNAPECPYSSGELRPTGRVPRERTASIKLPEVARASEPFVHVTVKADISIIRSENMSPTQRLAAVIAVAVLVVSVAVLVTSGWKRESDVLVLCGGSMRAVMEDVIARYAKVSSDKVLASYGGSGELCAQLQQTQKGDIYVCHDPFMSWAVEQDLVDTWATVGSLEVVIIVPKGNPRGIEKLEDLATGRLRLGIGDRTYSTSGQVVVNILKKLDYGQDILANVRAETKGHQQRCTDVAMGTLDAGIVWNAVAHLWRDRLDIIPIPKKYVDTVTSATYGKSDLRDVKVTIGITVYAGDKPHVRDFYDFATTRCRDVFEEYGFVSVED